MRVPRITSATIICGVHRKELIIGRSIDHKKSIIGDKRKRCLRPKVQQKLQKGIRIIQHIKWTVSGRGGRELMAEHMVNQVESNQENAGKV